MAEENIEARARAPLGVFYGGGGVHVAGGGEIRNLRITCCRWDGKIIKRDREEKVASSK